VKHIENSSGHVFFIRLNIVIIWITFDIGSVTTCTT